MPPCSVSLPVSWLKQLPGLCGPACAEMVLASRGKAIPQPQIWAEVQANTDGPSGMSTGFMLCGGFPTQICEACAGESFCWCTHPDALATTLNDHLPGSPYLVLESSSDSKATDRAISSVDAGVPPVVLVFGVKHWVVVYGYHCGGADPSRVTHLLLHDPAETPDPDEVQTDGIPISDWEADYLEKATCGQYASSVVLLGAGAPQGALKVDRGPSEAHPMIVLEPTAVLDLARNEARRLRDTGRWDLALAGAEAQRPMLVRHLAGGQPYYVVHFTVNGRPTARLLVNAVTGAPGQILGVRSAAANLPPFVPPPRVPPQVNGREVTMADGRVIRVDANTMQVSPELVWRPCDQSFSKMRPFYEIRVGADTVYLRVDGELFPALTDRAAGA